MRVWNYASTGELVASIDVESLEEARRLAADWNAAEDRQNMKVVRIADQPNGPDIGVDLSELPLFR